MENRYREYYAAANGFSGFRSYFNEVFASDTLKRLFILKGGPGTGKSSLMRKILNFFSEKGYDTDAVFCSSDTSSLDGIIIEGKAAVIDGTAPHETDTKLPGAFDEIVNLGDNWNKETLENHLEKIKELDKNKKQNYSSAYKYLSFLGNIHDYKLEILSHYLDFAACESFILSLIKAYQKSERKPRQTIISSFSKDGLSHRDLYGFDIKKIYSVKETYGEGELFLNELKRLASGKFSITLFPSPFSDAITEAVYFENEKILFSLASLDGEAINASDFLSVRFDEELEFLNKTEESYIEKSKLYFKKASDCHFLLEDIYKSSMNFENNDKIYKILCAEIEKILSD